MLIFGVNDSSHDAAISVVGDGEILFAAHSERYNKEKNTFCLAPELLDEAFSYGVPDVVAYFEKRNIKRLRKLFSGGINGQYSNLYKKRNGEFKRIREVQVGHHRSHAAAGFLTSPFAKATVVVIDAIGEFSTASIWSGNGNELKQLYSLRYPNSFGLFYSALTKYVGLRPGVDEYILMGMSAFGDRNRFYERINNLFPSFDQQKENFHYGLKDQFIQINDDQDRYDLAAATQRVFEERLIEFMKFARLFNVSDNLVYMGGCALNCLANTRLWDIWQDIWIMPNPGDAGSSLGAALHVLGERVAWGNSFLGHEILAPYPLQQIIEELSANKIVAVANGRAEFGPRALGNRSLLADPRSADIKDLVNSVKKREKFRPFAPIVPLEYVNEWFELKGPSPYMQYAVKCKRPESIPSVVHVDGTSRVQTVSKNNHPQLHQLLIEWGRRTGVPILLNTSLNIKDQPLLNDLSDVQLWSSNHPHVKILTGVDHA